LGVRGVSVCCQLKRVGPGVVWASLLQEQQQPATSSSSTGRAEGCGPAREVWVALPGPCLNGKCIDWVEVGVGSLRAAQIVRQDGACC
jgi:hypothetical protein